MKCLTIKEPWASLIINGYKKYEFRTWKTSYRGKILIHAGKTFDKNYKEIFSSYNLDYGNGEIIGEATIIDCVKVTKELTKKLKQEDSLVYANDQTDKYAFFLSNIKKYDKRTSCNGSLSLWNYK